MLSLLQCLDAIVRSVSAISVRPCICELNKIFSIKFHYQIEFFINHLRKNDNFVCFFLSSSNYSLSVIVADLFCVLFASHLLFPLPLILCVSLPSSSLLPHILAPLLHSPTLLILVAG